MDADRLVQSLQCHLVGCRNGETAVRGVIHCAAVASVLAKELQRLALSADDSADVLRANPHRGHPNPVVVLRAHDRAQCAASVVDHFVGMGGWVWVAGKLFCD